MKLQHGLNGIMSVVLFVGFGVTGLKSKNKHSTTWDRTKVNITYEAKGLGNPPLPAFYSSMESPPKN